MEKAIAAMGEFFDNFAIARTVGVPPLSYGSSVDKTVRTGIRKIRTQFDKYAWSTRKMDKIRAFDKYQVE